MEVKIVRKMMTSLLAVLMFFTLSLTVSAAPEKAGELHDKTINGSVDITSSGASAQTNINARPEDSSTIVTLSYSYLNTKTNKITTIKKTEIGRNVANVTIQKPKHPNYVSLEAVATHRVTSLGQKWDTRTVNKTAIAPFMRLFTLHN